MGSTNKTAHYNLPQFIGTDKPGWLTDVNDAMQRVDEGIYQAAVAAQGAQTSADAATSAIQTVNADLNDTKTTLTATTSTAQSALTNTQQQAGQIAQNSTNVSTINARLGNTDISSIGGGTVTGAIKAISEQAGATIDDTVTTTSEHAVKSSGIASYVQGISAGLTFGQDSSGNWGYKIGGADPVIPFRQGAELEELWTGNEGVTTWTGGTVNLDVAAGDVILVKYSGSLSYTLGVVPSESTATFPIGPGCPQGSDYYRSAGLSQTGITFGNGGTGRGSALPSFGVPVAVYRIKNLTLE